MKPIKTEKTVLWYRGPAGSTQKIGDLPCYREDGGVISVWEPSGEERKAISEGANIELGIYYEPIPPVSVNVTFEPKAL